jgi:hypothetical protein
MVLEHPSWGDETDLRIAKVWSGAYRYKAREKKLRWLARKQGKAEQGAC